MMGTAVGKKRPHLFQVRPGKISPRKRGCKNVQFECLSLSDPGSARGEYGRKKRRCANLKGERKRAD